MTENISLAVSDKVARQERPTRIKKGYYIGKLKRVKKRMENKEDEWEGKFGRQLVFLFEIFTLEGQPVTITKEREGGGTITENVMLPSFQYYLFKNKQTGELQTAVTQNSRITKFLTALGWSFDPSREIQLQDFVGRIVEINVDDYEKTDENGLPVVMSVTKDFKRVSQAQIAEFNSGGVFNESSPDEEESKQGSDDIDLEELEDLEL